MSITLLKQQNWAHWANLLTCFAVLAVCLVMGSCGLQDRVSLDSKPVRIQFSTWGGAEEIRVIRDVVADFEAKHPDVRVDVLHIPHNYYQKLHILIAGGLMPDVVFTNSISFPVYARHGLFADLRPYLDASPHLDVNAFFKPALAVFQLDSPDSVGAVPRDVSNVVVYYNRDLFKARQVSLPTSGWTWAEFLEKAQTLTVDTDQDGRIDQFGVSFNRRSPIFWLPFVWSAGGQLFNEPGDTVTLDEPEALKGLQFYADWQNRYHIAPRRTESGSAKMSELFLQQKLAMLVDGRWRVPSLRKKATFHWDVVPLPSGPAGSVTGLDSSGYAMAAGTEHPEVAWAFIEYLSSPEVVSRFTESGLIIPARRDVANSAVFLTPDKQPSNSQVFLDVIESGRPTRSHPRWNELSEQMNLALEPVWDGKRSAEEAMKQVKPKLKRIMKVVRR